MYVSSVCKGLLQLLYQRHFTALLHSGICLFASDQFYYQHQPFLDNEIIIATLPTSFTAFFQGMHLSSLDNLLLKRMELSLPFMCPRFLQLPILEACQGNAYFIHTNLTLVDMSTFEPILLTFSLQKVLWMCIFRKMHIIALILRFVGQTPIFFLPFLT